MKVRLVPAAFALGLSLACSPAEDRAETARTDALEALQRGQRRAALEAIEELRSVQPESAEALLELTQLLVAAGEAAQAVWLVQDGLRQFPDRDDVRLALARTALLTNDPALARSVLLEIPAASAQHPDALLLLAQAELVLGDLARALEILEAGAARYPDRPQMRIHRIATLIRERRFDEANDAIADARRGVGEESLARVRQLEATLYGLAFAEGIEPGAAALDAGTAGSPELTPEQKKARVAENRERALDRLRALVAEEPDDLQLWGALVDAYWKAGRAEEAVALVGTRLAAQPDQVGLYPYQSRLHSSLGQLPEAAAAMREFAERSNSPSGHLALANYQSDLDDEVETLAILDEALERFPGTPLLLEARTEALIGMGRLEEAREELARFEAAAPDAPEGEFLRGQLELTSGDAEAAAERLLRLVPDFDTAGTQFWLGRALEALGDRAGAERRYRLAFARQPNQPILSRAVIHMAEQRGDWQLVVAYGQRLLGLEPLAEDAWEVLVRALIQLDQGEAAATIARQAVTRFEENPRLRGLLVRALSIQARYDEALAEAAAATERIGGSAEIEAERALALGMRGAPAEGADVAAAALARYPDSQRLHLAQAALLFEQGDALAGSAAIDRALALAPGDPAPYRLRAEFRAARGLLEGAEQDCRNYLASRPDDPMVHHILGVVLAGEGRTDEATRAYERAAELDGTAWAPRNNLAELLREKGDVDGALAWAQKAFALAEGDPSVADTLGWLYLEKGLVKRSVGLLEEAHTGVPDHPIVTLHLALAYRADGQSENARRLLTDLEAKSRSHPGLHAEVLEALHSLD